MRISHAVGTQSGCRAGSGTSTLAPSRAIATRSRRSNKVRLSVPLLAAECLAAREDRDCGVAQGQPGDARAHLVEVFAARKGSVPLALAPAAQHAIVNIPAGAVRAPFDLSLLCLRQTGEIPRRRGMTFCQA